MDRHPVYIAHTTEPGEPFREHLTDNNGSTTLCGITWDSLPDVIYTRDDGSTFTLPDDKPMYADHDRPDVQTCQTCALNGGAS